MMDFITTARADDKQASREFFHALFPASRERYDRERYERAMAEMFRVEVGRIGEPAIQHLSKKFSTRAEAAALESTRAEIAGLTTALNNTLTLARMKWGNLDADGQRDFRGAEADAALKGNCPCP